MTNNWIIILQQWNNCRCSQVVLTLLNFLPILTPHTLPPPLMILSSHYPSVASPSNLHRFKNLGTNKILGNPLKRRQRTSQTAASKATLAITLTIITITIINSNCKIQQPPTWLIRCSTTVTRKKIWWYLHQMVVAVTIKWPVMTLTLWRVCSDKFLKMKTEEHLMS